MATKFTAIDSPAAMWEYLLANEPSGKFCMRAEPESLSVCVYYCDEDATLLFTIEAPTSAYLQALVCAWENMSTLDNRKVTQLGDGYISIA